MKQIACATCMLSDADQQGRPGMRWCALLEVPVKADYFCGDFRPVQVGKHDNVV